VNVPMPGGRTAAQRYAGGTVTWVDGGMLRNFPITAFDRIDGKPPAGRPSASSSIVSMPIPDGRLHVHTRLD